MTIYLIDDYIFTSITMAHEYLTTKEKDNK